MLNKISINYISDFIENKTEQTKEALLDIHVACKKYLTIIACHADTTEKIFFLKKNIENVSFSNNDIVVINTAGLRLNAVLQKEIEEKVFKYIEVKNNGWLDFGKWHHVLNEIDHSGYDFITFTNDSFIICEPMMHFYYQASSQNVELFAYTSSTEVQYHYQSYLFIIQQKAINKFLKYIQSYLKIPDPNPVLLEINLYNVFATKQCFLDIGYFPINFKQNIFFNKNGLYSLLFNSKLLPFIKRKRLHPKPNYYNQFSRCDFSALSKTSYRGFSNDFKRVIQGVHDCNPAIPFSQNKLSNDGLNPDMQETFG